MSICDWPLLRSDLTNAQAGRTDIAIARVEQLTPFPFDKVAKQIKLYHNAEVGGRGAKGGDSSFDRGRVRPWQEISSFEELTAT